MLRRKRSIFLCLALLLTSLASTAMEEDVLRSQKPLKIMLADTIPGGEKKAEIVTFLKSVPITPVDVDHEVGINKTGGFSFPTTAPWSLMMTKHIKSLKVRPNLGDWGCGGSTKASSVILI